MHDLNDLYFFAQVVDHGGFAPAGRALDIPKSKLSRRVSMLEDRLGVRLIQRSTRHFSVTEIGQTFHTHCKAMLVEAESAHNAIEQTRSEPRGIVRFACPVTLLDTRVGEMIADFMVEYRGVEVHLEATNRRVDLLAENIDVAIRVRPPPLEDSELVMRVLAERRQCLVASPGLLARLGSPQTPSDLPRLPTMELGRPQSQHVWNLHGPAGEVAQVRHEPRLVTRGMLTLRCAALAGVGVVQLPKMVVRDAVESGALIHVLPDWAPRPEIIHAVFPSRRGLLPSVRALIDFLVLRFRQIEEE
ncbi:LysR family transcriptional regulator [Achromobacter marplatensis]|uniref:LysR family transcriptional regulator n=1 Tax=Achromobacter marplatensis TaxID=470868 RepID=UPI0039F662B2